MCFSLYMRKTDDLRKRVLTSPDGYGKGLLTSRASSCFISTNHLDADQSPHRGLVHVLITKQLTYHEGPYDVGVTGHLMFSLGEVQHLRSL
jgi:hypothetical protein